MLRDEYRIREVTRVRADDLRSLAEKMEGVDANTLLATIEEFNGAVEASVPFDPTIKDGRGTPGLTIPKSNWANTLDTPPFEAYGVTCGVTFTFGGLHVDAQARVISQTGEPIPGLFAAGELVGGLFYFNYPGGSGLTSGAVFGRIAGAAAAGKR
jgi:tricarballylate dehydrogenase